MQTLAAPRVRRGSLDGDLTDTLTGAFAMGEEDVTNLARDVYAARIEGITAAYQQAVADAGGTLPTAWTIPDDVLRQQAAESLDTARQVAATYGRDLERHVTANLAEYGAAAAEEQAKAIGQWAQDRAVWKSAQIANTETGRGVHAGTDLFLNDVRDDPEALGFDVDASFDIAIVPDDSSGDFCADFAGEVYPASEYDNLPEFPAHAGCIHQTLVIAHNDGLSANEEELDAEAGDGEGLSPDDLEAEMQAAADEWPFSPEEVDGGSAAAGPSGFKTEIADKETPVATEHAAPTPPKPSRYEPQRTLADIQSWVAAEYPRLTVADFTGLNVAQANELVGEYVRLADLYPETANQLRAIFTSESHFFLNDFKALLPDVWEQWNNPGIMMVTNRINGQMFFINTKPFQNPRWREMLEWFAQEGHFYDGAGRIASMVAHEFGHMFEAWVRSLPEGAKQLDYLFGAMPFLNSPISLYSRTVAYEQFAEAFSAIQYGSGAVRATDAFVQLEDFITKATRALRAAVAKGGPT